MVVSGYNLGCKLVLFILNAFFQPPRRDIIGAASTPLLDHKPLVLYASQFFCNKLRLATSKLSIGDRIYGTNFPQKDKCSPLIVVELERGKLLEPVECFLRKEVAEQQTNSECRRIRITPPPRLYQTPRCNIISTGLLATTSLN